MEMARTMAWFFELQAEEVPNWMVVVMGVGIVFVGLLFIIAICKIMSLFFVGKKETEKNTTVVKSTVAQNAVIENRQEIIAAVTAVCAEEMGKDISALRVISFKKI